MPMRSRKPQLHHNDAVTSGRRLFIWGAGGHAMVVADVARAAGWSVRGFASSNPSNAVAAQVTPGLEAISQGEFLEAVAQGAATSFDAVAVAIGDNAARWRAFETLAGRVPTPPMVHPEATVSPSAVIGDGAVVMARAVVNASSRLLEVCIVNSGAVVEHECTIGPAAHVSPGATLAGNVTVARLAWIGAGSTVIQGRCIGAGAIVGAGAVVIRDVSDGATVVGVPAAPIVRNQPAPVGPR